MSYTDRALTFLAARGINLPEEEAGREQSEEGEEGPGVGGPATGAPVRGIGTRPRSADSGRHWGMNDGPPLVGPDARMVVVTSQAELVAVLPVLQSASTLGFDIETAGRQCQEEALDPHAGRIRLIQLATGGVTYVVDCDRLDPGLLAAIFSQGPTLVGHNLKFDLRFLMEAGLPIPGGERLFDTMLASQLLHAGTDARHFLAAVAERELGVTLDKAAQGSDWSGDLTEEQLTYAARDASVLLPLTERLRGRLRRDGLAAVMALEMGALPAIAWLEHTGAPLDSDHWKRLANRAAQERDEALAALALLAPDLNPNSVPQVKAQLAVLGIMVPNVQEGTLRAHADRHSLVAALLAHREAAKRSGTYGLAFLNYVHPATGRIHADYREIGAATGRMSCSKPNLQNIPRDPAYRACFRPGLGQVLVKADYSQIELRIAAQLSGDTAMREAFRRGDDLHVRTARAVLGREPNEADRQLAKALNFGLVYGMGATRLREYARASYGVDLTEADAQRFRERFFAAYPGLRAWHRRQSPTTVASRTLKGRRRLGVERFTDKLNSPIQGTGADVLKLALAHLWHDRGAVFSAIPVLAVHDEIVIEVAAEEAEASMEWLRGHMEAAGREIVADVPIAVEAAIVADWNEAAAPVVESAATEERLVRTGDAPADDHGQRAVREGGRGLANPGEETPVARQCRRPDRSRAARAPDW
jgi:DNA polymerase-1